MDYQRMWNRLVEEMQMLQQMEVSCLHPAVVITYMSFIVQLEKEVNNVPE